MRTDSSFAWVLKWFLYDPLLLGSAFLLVLLTPALILARPWPPLPVDSTPPPHKPGQSHMDTESKLYTQLLPSHHLPPYFLSKLICCTFCSASIPRHHSLVPTVYTHIQKYAPKHETDSEPRLSYWIMYIFYQTCWQSADMGQMKRFHF